MCGGGRVEGCRAGCVHAPVSSAIGTASAIGPLRICACEGAQWRLPGTYCRMGPCSLDSRPAESRLGQMPCSIDGPDMHAIWDKRWIKTGRALEPKLGQ